jgi:phospholipid/cholesterol/gamma-HCH transport system substrate-binding protein
VAASAVLLPVLLAAGLLTGCSGGAKRISATVTFDDVADMANGALVELADVAIGKVESIKLVGNRARLHLRFRADAKVPLDVTARVRRTSVIGEKFVELRPNTTDLDAPLLPDGAVITRAEVVPDLEQLVGSGTAVFSAISSTKLATLIAENAQGFGGNGAVLSKLLDDLERITAGFRSRTTTVATLIDALDQLGSDLGPRARANAQALANLATTTQILSDQRQELVALITSLKNLSVEGRSIFDQHLAQVGNQLRALRSVTQAVADRQRDLGLLLVNLPGHNEALRRGTVDDFVQVLNDFIVCGLPNGGEDPTSPLNSCSYVPQAPQQ